MHNNNLNIHFIIYTYTHKRENRKLPNFIEICVNVFSICSRGARNSKIAKKWPESSRVLDYILS